MLNLLKLIMVLHKSPLRALLIIVAVSLQTKSDLEKLICGEHLLTASGYKSTALLEVGEPVICFDTKSNKLGFGEVMAKQGHDTSPLILNMHGFFEQTVQRSFMQEILSVADAIALIDKVMVKPFAFPASINEHPMPFCNDSADPYNLFTPTQPTNIATGDTSLAKTMQAANDIVSKAAKLNAANGPILDPKQITETMNGIILMSCLIKSLGDIINAPKFDCESNGLPIKYGFRAFEKYFGLEPKNIVKGGLTVEDCVKYFELTNRKDRKAVTNFNTATGELFHWRSWCSFSFREGIIYNFWVTDRKIDRHGKVNVLITAEGGRVGAPLTNDEMAAYSIDAAEKGFFFPITKSHIPHWQTIQSPGEWNRQTSRIWVAIYDHIFNQNRWIICEGFGHSLATVDYEGKSVHYINILGNTFQGTIPEENYDLYGTSRRIIIADESTWPDGQGRFISYDACHNKGPRYIVRDTEQVIQAEFGLDGKALWINPNSQIEATCEETFTSETYNDPLGNHWLRIVVKKDNVTTTSNWGVFSPNGRFLEEVAPEDASTVIAELVQEAIETYGLTENRQDPANNSLNNQNFNNNQNNNKPPKGPKPPRRKNITVIPTTAQSSEALFDLILKILQSTLRWTITLKNLAQKFIIELYNNYIKIAAGIILTQIPADRWTELKNWTIDKCKEYIQKNYNKVFSNPPKELTHKALSSLRQKTDSAGNTQIYHPDLKHGINIDFITRKIYVTDDKGNILEEMATD